jgi:hypothetical protein
VFVDIFLFLFHCFVFWSLGNVVEAGAKIYIEGISAVKCIPKQINPTSNSLSSKASTSSQPSDTTGSLTVEGITPFNSNTTLPQNEEPTMTDDEAIAKLLEEDLKLSGGNHNQSDQHGISSSDNIRAPDAAKNMRLFDPDPDPDDDIMNFGLNMGGDVAYRMSRFGDPHVGIMASNRHGRQPLRDLSDTRPTIKPRSVAARKHIEFEAPIMNQDVVDNARAAGLSETEIGAMFDAEYSERLQANEISNQMGDDNDNEYIPVDEGATNDLHYGRGMHHNRFQELTDLAQDDDDENNDTDSNEMSELAKNMTALSTESPPRRCRSIPSTDYISVEEERLIQEILATSLAEAEEQEKIETVNGRANVACSDLPLFRSNAPKVHPGGGSVARGHKSGDSRSANCKPSTATPYTRNNISRSPEMRHNGNDHAGGGLSLEGKRMGFQRDVTTSERTHYQKVYKLPCSTAASIPHEQTGDGVPSVIGSSVFPIPASEINVQRTAQSSYVNSTSSNSHGADDSCIGVLNDSMDDEVMAWVLKISEQETGAVCSPGVNDSKTTTSNRYDNNFQAQSKPYSTNVASRVPSKFLMKPDAKVEMRMAASENADKLLERINAELLPGDGQSVNALNPMNLITTSTATMNRLPDGISRFRSDFDESVVRTDHIVREESKVYTDSVDVSAMDEDEQLAWALQQSML